MSTIAERLRPLFLGRDDVDLAVLYGSGARDALRADSDVDVAMRWRAGTAQRHAFLADLERAVGRTLDPVDIDVAPPQLRFEIARDGLSLFEREPGTWSRARARAFVDWWDFRPIAKMIHRAAIARLSSVLVVRADVAEKNVRRRGRLASRRCESSSPPWARRRRTPKGIRDRHEAGPPVRSVGALHSGCIAPGP